MTNIILAEHDGQKITPATRATIAAAQKAGGDCAVLVLGSGIDTVAQHAAGCDGVAKVLTGDDARLEHSLAEGTAAVVVSKLQDGDVLWAPASTFGKNSAPRIAALKDWPQISDIIAVDDETTFKRPIYAGNVIATVSCDEASKVVTVRGTAFDPVAESGGSAAIEAVDLSAVDGDLPSSSFVKLEASEGDRPDLTSATCVVSGGRGVGSGENFKLIEDLADKLGAAVGASRAAVDAGFVPNDYQVGQTGKIVAPELYIAVGISGAIQHLAGMSESKVIVAINKDPDAPIFEVADYGLEADLFEAVPELIEKL